MSLEKELEILKQLKKQMGLRTANTIPKRENQNEYPLSYAQERMWFASELKSSSAAYNIPLAMRMTGPADFNKLEQVFNRIIQKHEVLRAGFENSKGTPTQHINPYQEVKIPVIKINGETLQKKEKKANEQIKKSASVPFSLSSGPLYKIEIYKLTEEDHILLLVFHHIVFDGWSTGVLMQEITDLFTGKKSEELNIQYADYAQWQRGRFENGDLDRQSAYWKKKIGENPPLLMLPADSGMNKEGKSAGSIKRFEVDSVIVSAIRDASVEYKVSPFVIFIAAYYVFLYKYTNQKELILGVPVANRQQMDTERLIGCIANTLPLKADIDHQETSVAFMRKISEIVREAQDHEELPFDKLVDLLNVTRSLTNNPVFQSMFVYQRKEQSTLRLDKCLLQPYEVETGTSKFDLSLSLLDTPERIEGFFEYSTIFEEETINRMINSYLQILSEMILSPNERLGEIKAITPIEESYLLGEKSCKYPKEGNIHERFAEQVKKFPNRTAIVYGTEEITYAELDQESNRMANYLRKNGVGRETRVAILQDRSISYIISILGVLKAGGTYIPLDPEQPESRLLYIIEDSRCNIVISHAKFKNTFSLGGNYKSIIYEEDPWNLEGSGGNSMDVYPEQVAYIIYTSGSTGKPKGVLNTHHNVRRLFWSAEEHFAFSENDAWTLFHSLAFDFTIWEIWGALFYGGKLVIVPSEVRRSPNEFLNLLLQQNITVLNQTPSAFKELLHEMEKVPANLNLKYIIFGGEALHFDDLSRWFEKYGDRTHLINMYGITETTVHVTWREVRLEETHEGSKSLIGRPLNDLKIYILNEDFQPVPIGVQGEIFVSGDGVARGYNNRFALTAERFIPDPFSNKGGRLYRTGDVGRILPSGDIEYIGRADDQVKIKGHRIELGEIKSYISNDPSIKDCEVTVRINENNEKEIAAFVVFKELANDIAIKGLRQRLLHDLPKYMFPAHLHSVDSIPLTTNGKADKAALLKLCGQHPGRTARLPETNKEKTLAGIWQEILNKKQVYLDDNFFSLGGDSIRCLKVISKAEEVGYLFTLEDLFQNQTIEELVQLLNEPGRQVNRKASLEPFALVPEEEKTLIPEGVKDVYPLAKVQEGMFFHMEQYPEQPLYHNIDSVLLKGKFDYSLFSKAVQKVVAGNVMLRTSFDLKNFSIPMQMVHENALLPVGFMDIRHLDHPDQENIIDEYVQEEKKKTFDLTRPSLLRFFIHQRSEETFQFSLTECHLIFDGWSLTSTLAEIFEVYFNLLEGEEIANREELAIDYRDFIYLEQEAINSAEHIEFWKEFLAECQVLKLPVYEEKRKQKGTFRVRRRIVELSKETSRKLKQVSEEYRIPVKSMLLGSHIKALQSITGQSDIVTGMVSNGRMEEKDGEKVKGLFINTLPFRQQVFSGSWIDHMKMIFETEQKILPFRRLPLPEIQRHINQSTLFDTAFNYVYFHSMEPLLTSDKIQVEGYNSHSANDTHFKLMVTFSNHPPDYEIRLTLAYDESTFTESQMDLIAGIYHTILKSIAECPEEPHNDRSFLPDDIYEKVVFGWNSNEETFNDEHLSLHELIQKQDGGRVALIERNKEYTYQWLDRESDKVAAYLQSRGMTNDFIGIYMDRSAEMIAGLVGILKSGCAYVPLDTSYPEDRIKYMLKDSKVKCTLTTEKRSAELEGITDSLIDIENILHASRSLPIQKSAPKLAYMIYTSGSTGRPKGTMVAHKGVVNRILWMQKHYGISQEERGLHKTPLSFDYSVFEIFSTLCTGGALVLAKPEGHKDSSYLAGLIKEHQITTLFFVPTMLQEFLKALEAGSITTIKRVMCSGEPLTSQIKDSFFRMFDAELYNQYGPTEASVEVTSFACRREDAVVRIGRPMSNTKIYILDDNLHPSGIGVPGEIYIGGLGLAAAYHGKPSLTAESFIPSPFSSLGERLYKTGDLAQYSPEGEIEYIGRKDSQVKMRGLRIELSEIESIIREQPEFKEGVVIYRKDDLSPSGMLVAYVIPENGEQLNEKEAKRILRKSLPRFMVPERIILMEELPVNPNGKLDRSKLPAPMLGSVSERDITPATSVMERKMVKIFQQILGVDQIGIHDDFFELGGNSLNVVHLMGQIEKMLGQKIPLDVIYEKPTIHEILEEATGRNSITGRINAFTKNELTSRHGELFTEVTDLGPTLFFISEMEAIYQSSMIPQATDLAEAIGSDYRIIAIQPPPFVKNLEEADLRKVGTLIDELAEPYINLKEIAQLTVKGIRKIQSQGPFIIGAQSTGCMLALEVVKILEIEGEEIETLFLIEDNAISEPLKRETDDPLVKEEFLRRAISKTGGDESYPQSLKELPEDEIWEKTRELLVDQDLISEEVQYQDIYTIFQLDHFNRQIKKQLWNSGFPGKVRSNLLILTSGAKEGNFWTSLTEGKVMYEELPKDTIRFSPLHLEGLKTKLVKPKNSYQEQVRNEL